MASLDYWSDINIIHMQSVADILLLSFKPYGWVNESKTVVDG